MERDMNLKASTPSANYITGNREQTRGSLPPNYTRKARIGSWLEAVCDGP
jgi:hypothetical protein